MAVFPLRRPPTNEREVWGAVLLKHCNQILADLRCVQLVCIFKPKHFDFDIIWKHLVWTKSRIDFLGYKVNSHGSPYYNAISPEEWECFTRKVIELLKGTNKIIQAFRDHNQLRLTLQAEMFEEIFMRAHPKYKAGFLPWSQFLAYGAPSLMVTHFLAPYVTPPPKDSRMPLVQTIVSSAVQALPHATSAILGRWSWEFKVAIDYYHALHPHDAEFSGPIQSKLIPTYPVQSTEQGVQMERSQLHSLGNVPYAHAMQWVTASGGEQKSILARFLGKLENKETPTAAAANRVYVYRRWILAADK